MPQKAASPPADSGLRLGPGRPWQRELASQTRPQQHRTSFRRARAQGAAAWLALSHQRLASVSRRTLLRRQLAAALQGPLARRQRPCAARAAPACSSSSAPPCRAACRGRRQQRQPAHGLAAGASWQRARPPHPGRSQAPISAHAVQQHAVGTRFHLQAQAQGRSELSVCAGKA